ncbi:hypothetical protein [Curtobacterium aurantiacum]|nr:hypothetical protein [Curtobacterium flaccumfaciens]
MSISDFDVEPRTGSRFGAVVLGIASAIVSGKFAEDQRVKSVR